MAEARLAGILAGAGLALLAAGCGGGASRVATVASSTTTVATTAPSQAAAPSGQGGGGAQTGFVMNVGAGNAAQGTKLSNCVRSHGFPSFPDPDGRGLIVVTGIDRHSPEFQSAVGACQKLLPADFGQAPTPAQQAQQRQGALALARCMRAHGIGDFPDPTGNSRPANLSPDLDPNDPAFQRAAAACRSLLPGGKGIPG